MLFYYILFLVGACVAAKKGGVETPRIILGKSIKIENANYAASYGGHCGASILSKRWLITTASCGWYQFVKIKSTTLNIREGLIVEVDKYVIHPKYDKKTGDYDYQLLKLKEEIAFNEKASPIAIGNEDDVTKEGSRIVMVGWGQTRENRSLPGAIYSINYPIRNKDQCEKLYKDQSIKVTERMFCAGFDQDDSGGGCWGDNGNPAVVHKKLIGMFLFSKACALADSPDRFISVPHVKQWIENEIKK